MQRLSSYRTVTNLSAFLLIIGVSFPTSLCAGQLIDFSSHTSATESTDMPGMDESHDMQSETDCHSSVPTATPSDHLAHHDCEGDADCTCHFDQVPLKDQKWVVTPGIPVTDLAAATAVVREDHADYSRYYFAHPEHYTPPPIFILNSTFLN